MGRWTFLRTGVTAGLVGGLAGCAGDTSDDSPTTPHTTTEDSATTTEAEQTTEQPEETTEDQPDIDRPANYRWEMRPSRNDLLRAELGQYVEASVGDVVEEHPAFEYSTDSDRDDHEIESKIRKAASRIDSPTR